MILLLIIYNKFKFRRCIFIMLKKKKPTVFVIMPFREEFFEVFDLLKEHFKEEYEFKHASTDKNHRNIMQDVVQGLKEADVVIANLSTLNSNVLYELGVAHTLNKKVICVMQTTESKGLNEKLPFDISPYTVYKYELDMNLLPRGFYRDMKKKEQEGVDVDVILKKHWPDFSSLCEKLKLHLEGAVNGTSESGNPVSDNIGDIGKHCCDMIFNKTQLNNKPDWEDFNKLIELMVRRQIGNYADIDAKGLNLNNYLMNGLKMTEEAVDDYCGRKKNVTSRVGYINKILSRWWNSGYMTPEAIQPDYTQNQGYGNGPNQGYYNNQNQGYGNDQNQGYANNPNQVYANNPNQGYYDNSPDDPNVVIGEYY